MKGEDKQSTTKNRETMTTDSIITGFGTALTTATETVTTAHLEVAGSLLEALSAVVIACAALRGLNGWLRERRYDFAVETLTQVYRAQTALKIIRHPIRFKEYSNDNEDSQAKRFMKDCEEHEGMVKEYQDAFVELNALVPRFKAVYNPDSGKFLEEFVGFFNDILDANAKRYQIESARSILGYYNHGDLERVSRLQAILVKSDDDSNEFDVRVMEAVKDVEDVLRPTIDAASKHIKKGGILSKLKFPLFRK